MSTVTDELLLRIAVVGGAVAAEEVAAFDERIGAAGDTATKSTKSFKGMGNALMSLKTLFAAIGVVEAVKQFASFQAQMELLKTQTGATQGEVNRMSKTVLNMATSVATGPNSLAQALYHIESIQLRGKQAANVLRIAAEGAKVGMANLVDVTNALDATIVGHMVPGTNNFKAAMGQLNATTGAGDMTMQNLASAMSTGILSSMSRVGLKLIDVNAALAVLGDNNIRGTQAANRLRMGLLQIVKPTTEAADAMHTLGMGTFQLASDYYKPNGLMVMLEDIHKHIDGLSKIKQNDFLMTLFGRGRMSAGIMTLYDQMGRLQAKYTAIQKGQGDFNDEWASTKNNVQFVIDQLKTLGQVILIRVGGAIEKAYKWFRKGGPMQQGIEYSAVAALGIYTAMRLATGAALAFNIMVRANPLGLVLTGATLMIIGLIKYLSGGSMSLTKAWKGFATFWKETWIDMKTDAINGVNGILAGINVLIRGFNSLVGKIPGIGSSLKIGQIGYLGAKNAVETSPGHYTPLYQLEQPGSGYAKGLRLQTPLSGNLSGWPTSQPGAASPHQPGWNLAPTPNIQTTVMLDGKVIAKAVLKQNLNATARRGVGGPTVADSGS